MVIADRIIIGHSLWNDLSGTLPSPLFLPCASPPLLLLFPTTLCSSRLVVGLPHRAVATRDVALYRPFRETLRMNQMIGLPTLMWHFMNREVQKERVDPVSSCILPLNALRTPSELSTDFLQPSP